MKKELHTSVAPLLCPQCGSDQFIHPENTNLQSQVQCAECGHLDTAEVLAINARNAQAKKLASEAVRASLRKLLK